MATLSRSAPMGSKPHVDELGAALRSLQRWRLLFLLSTGLLALLVWLSTRGSIASALPTLQLLRFAGLGLLVSGIYATISVSGRIPLTYQAYLQFLGDLLLVSWLVYTTGGANSSFSLLYLLVIAAAANTLRRRAAITVAEIGWLLYAATVISLYQGWFARSTTETSAGRLAYVLFVHLVGFYGVAVLIARLGRAAARAERDLAVATGDLVELEAFHRDVVASMSSGLILLDLDDRVIDINRTGREILRLETVEEGVPLMDLGLIDAKHWQRIRGEADHERIRDELAFEDDEGSKRHVGFSVGVIRGSDETPRGHSIVFQELTKWRRLENELSEKERMAAVGELAAGLAHEIGNPLAAISGSVQLLRSSLHTEDGGSPQTKLLDIVIKESERLDRTVKEFLSFARPHERRTRRFDLAQLIEENMELLQNSPEVSQDHQLLVDLSPTPLMILADRDQISQVFWNLARNAIRAMPEGGSFSVVGRLKEAETSEAIEQLLSLRFADTGLGMTEDQRHGLFHPFRSYQGGIGIGMAIVYRVVEEHGGEIAVESEPNEGTTIEITLPGDAPPSQEVAVKAESMHSANPSNPT